jgi:spore maturation protein CgeB
MKNIKPTIAFFGSSLVSAYWNGAATYYRGIIKYLFKQGYHITFYEPDAFGRQSNLDIDPPPWADVVVYANNESAVERAVRKASKADILVKASGVGVFDAYLEKALLEVRRSGQIVVFWDVDAPATLDSVMTNRDNPFRALIPEYDYILTYGGGKPVIDAYKALNARECIPVYNALDPETHFAVTPNPEFTCDLAFLGNRLPDRERRVYEFFINVAGVLPDKKFIMGGSGWDDVQFPSNVKYIGHVFTADHNAFNSSPLAVLNISRDSMASYGFSPATRVFEAAGAGACMITDYWEGIDDFFTPGSEILVARNGNEVAEILTKVDKAKAFQIGQAAKAKVLKAHTYQIRAQQVDQIFRHHRVLSDV